MFPQDRVRFLAQASVLGLHGQVAACALWSQRARQPWISGRFQRPTNRAGVCADARGMQGGRCEPPLRLGHADELPAPVSGGRA